MAKQSSILPSASIVAEEFNHEQIISEYDLRSLGWELIDADDLYADVESLDSFSVSSQSGEEGAAADVSEDNQVDHGMTSDVLGFVSQSLQPDYGNCPDGFLHAGDLADAVETFQHDLVSYLGFQDSESIGTGVDSYGSGGRGDGSHHGDCVEDDIGYQLNSEKFVEQVPILGQPSRLEVARGVANEEDHLSGSQFKVGGIGIKDEEKDDYDDGCTAGLDDELVPWALTHRLDNQRMKKLGKRTKIRNSKKMAHIYTKAACARGKHGLGLMVY